MQMPQLALPACHSPLVHSGSPQAWVRRRAPSRRQLVLVAHKLESLNVSHCGQLRAVTLRCRCAPRRACQAGRCVPDSYSRACTVGAPAGMPRTMHAAAPAWRPARSPPARFLSLVPLPQAAARAARRELRQPEPGGQRAALPCPGGGQPVRGTPAGRRGCAKGFRAAAPQPARRRVERRQSARCAVPCNAALSTLPAPPQLVLCSSTLPPEEVAPPLSRLTQGWRRPHRPWASAGVWTSPAAPPCRVCSFPMPRACSQSGAGSGLGQTGRMRQACQRAWLRASSVGLTHYWFAPAAWPAASGHRRNPTFHLFSAHAACRAAACCGRFCWPAPPSASSGQPDAVALW